MEEFFWELCTERVQHDMLTGKKHKTRLPQIILNSQTYAQRITRPALENAGM